MNRTSLWTSAVTRSAQHMMSESPCLLQVLRRFLAGGQEDRRTMVTLMTGPVLERLRMAQEDARLRGGEADGDIP